MAAEEGSGSSCSCGSSSKSKLLLALFSSRTAVVFSSFFVRAVSLLFWVPVHSLPWEAPSSLCSLSLVSCWVGVGDSSFVPNMIMLARTTVVRGYWSFFVFDLVPERQKDKADARRGKMKSQQNESSRLPNAVYYGQRRPRCSNKRPATKWPSTVCCPVCIIRTYCFVCM